MTFVKSALIKHLTVALEGVEETTIDDAKERLLEYRDMLNKTRKDHYKLRPYNWGSNWEFSRYLKEIGYQKDGFYHDPGAYAHRRVIIYRRKKNEL